MKNVARSNIFQYQITCSEIGNSMLTKSCVLYITSSFMQQCNGKDFFLATQKPDQQFGRSYLLGGEKTPTLKFSKGQLLVVMQPA